MRRLPFLALCPALVLACAGDLASVQSAPPLPEPPGASASAPASASAALAPENPLLLKWAGPHGGVPPL
jgi:hypothetical protein